MTQYIYSCIGEKTKEKVIMNFSRYKIFFFHSGNKNYVDLHFEPLVWKFWLFHHHSFCQAVIYSLSDFNIIQHIQ